MNTVFYRTERKGDLKRRIEEDTQKQIRQDMYGNGYRIVAMYKGKVSYEQHDQRQLERGLQ